MKTRWAVILFWVAGVVLCASPAARADTFTFSVLPVGGAVSGPPGSTVGWGYVTTNQSAQNWLVLTAVSADVFLNGTPDSSIFNFPTLAPNATISQAYDAVNLIGLFQLTWDPTAPAGFVNSGVFTVSAEWWTGDPLAGGQFISLAIDQSAAYSAGVTPSATVPEPTSLLLVLPGLWGVWLRKKASKV